MNVEEPRDEDVSEEESIEKEDLADDNEQPPRRSTRPLIKRSFPFKNTPEPALLLMMIKSLLI